MKIFFDEIDHFHPNFDESVPNLCCSRYKSFMVLIAVHFALFSYLVSLSSLQAERL